jgi:TonB-linked SusC/RagA family outer membrane protein
MARFAFQSSSLKLLCILAMAVVSTASFAQKREIAGMVMEAGSTSPVVGANIVLKGTRYGVSTDLQGSFKINASTSDTLEISCLGYSSKMVPIAGRTSLRISLELYAEAVEGVIVVGYGTMKKSDVTSSIASVDVESMKVFPSGNPVEMLRGKVAGVTVSSVSGQPGTVPQIKIRGSRSISAGNAPLYVIDGCASSSTEFASINSDDIASIEILKDAAAQSIYGARASDGVVLVTTKRGKAGASTISYNGYFGLQQLWRNFDFFSGEEYYQMRREAVANFQGIVDASQLSVSETLNDDVMASVYRSGEFVDWEKLMFRQVAPYHNHELSIRGGSDNLRVAASIGFLDQTGILVTNSSYQKGTARLNVDYDVKKWLSIGINSSYSLSRQRQENGAFYQFITATPLAQVYNDDGSYAEYIDSSFDGNPLYKAQYDHRQTDANGYRLTGFLVAKPFKGFSYRLNGSLYSRVSEKGVERDIEYTGGGGIASIVNSTSANYTLENIFSYDVPFASKDHTLNVTAVQSLDSSTSKTLGYYVDNLPVDMGWNFISNGEITGYEREYGVNNLVSFTLRGQYGFMGRYLFNVAMRYDGSSRFGANDKWGFFPSAAFAWRISEEPFMKNSRTVDNLKVRLSYGKVGNQNGIGNYTTLGVSSSYPYEFGDIYYMGYSPSSVLSNPNLRWEQSTTLNLGVDFGLFKNRINGTVELYKTNTNDLLVMRSLNSALGYSSMLDNLGATTTMGIDLNINAGLISNKDFYWEAGLVFSAFRSKILKIDDALNADGSYASQPENGWIIGQPINIYYDYQFDGIYQYDDFDVVDDGGKYSYNLLPTIDSDGDGVADKVLQRDDKVEPGSVKLKDVNGDGKIDLYDRDVIKRDPDFTVSLTNTMTYRSFDLTAELYAVVGGNVLNPMIYDSEYGGGLRGSKNGMKMDYWTPNNTVNTYPRPNFGADIPYIKSCAYQSASYLRLRTLQIGYNFPERITSGIRASKMRVYATAANLLTLMKVKSYSPEVLGDSYPETRQFVLGINLTF